VALASVSGDDSGSWHQCNTEAAEYVLADEAYAMLLNKTSNKPISDALRQDLLSYYSDLEKPYATMRNAKAWHELTNGLEILRSESETQRIG
jgi:hypothetical protein